MPAFRQSVAGIRESGRFAEGTPHTNDAHWQTRALSRKSLGVINVGPTPSEGARYLVLTTRYSYCLLETF